MALSPAAASRHGLARPAPASLTLVRATTRAGLARPPARATFVVSATAGAGLRRPGDLPPSGWAGISRQPAPPRRRGARLAARHGLAAGLAVVPALLVPATGVAAPTTSTLATTSSLTSTAAPAGSTGPSGTTAPSGPAPATLAPTGTTGPTGPTGPQGLTGPTGPSSSSGPARVVAVSAQPSDGGAGAPRSRHTRGTSHGRHTSTRPAHHRASGTGSSTSPAGETTGGAIPQPVTGQAPVITTGPGAPPSGLPPAPSVAGALSASVTAGQTVFEAALGSYRIPVFLLGIYQAAGDEYGIPWQVLAAINEVETDYGFDDAVSSAGAVGWMQFMPATWSGYGVDAHGSTFARSVQPRRRDLRRRVVPRRGRREQ